MGLNEDLPTLAVAKLETAGPIFEYSPTISYYANEWLGGRFSS